MTSSATMITVSLSSNQEARQGGHAGEGFPFGNRWFIGKAIDCGQKEHSVLHGHPTDCTERLFDTLGPVRNQKYCRSYPPDTHHLHWICVWLLQVTGPEHVEA